MAKMPMTEIHRRTFNHLNWERVLKPTMPLAFSREGLPTKVSAQVLRHQLRVETRSRVVRDCATDYGLKFVA